MPGFIATAIYKDDKDGDKEEENEEEEEDPFFMASCPWVLYCPEDKDNDNDQGPGMAGLVMNQPIMAN